MLSILLLTMTATPEPALPAPKFVPLPVPKFVDVKPVEVLPGIFPAREICTGPNCPQPTQPTTRRRWGLFR